MGCLAAPRVVQSNGVPCSATERNAAIIQPNGMPMFYDTASSSANLRTLYISWAENVLGRVPVYSTTHAALRGCKQDFGLFPVQPHRFGGSQGAV